MRILYTNQHTKNPDILEIICAGYCDNLDETNQEGLQLVLPTGETLSIYNLSKNQCYGLVLELYNNGKADYTKFQIKGCIETWQ